MASNMMLLLFILMVLGANGAAESHIGMNWGRTSFQRLVPSMAVDLLLQNNISSARVFSMQEDVIKPFASSGITLSICLFTFNRAVSSLQDARALVRSRQQYFTSCNIRYLYVGFGVLKDGMNTKPTMNNAIDVAELMSIAVKESGYGDQVKVTFSHDFAILKNITRPSEGEFVDEFKDEMARILRILEHNNAPFVIEMFPISYVTEHNMDPEFAFMDNKSKFNITDINGKVYKNVVEFMYDGVIWALDKAGAPNMEVVIGQLGWPTDGYPGANVSTAERFYKSLLPWVASEKGTPLHPGPIEVYVHSLADENKMPYFYPFARHWGIYTSYGEPKYKIDVTGQGRDIYPTKAKGIMRMPKRWCVFNMNITDASKVKDHLNKACNKADCTSMAMGGSCSHLTYSQCVSYAFNMYFQSKFQDEKACDFQGLGKVVTEDPSTNGCTFPVEVVRGQQLQADGNSLHQTPQRFIFCLSILWALTWD